MVCIHFKHLILYVYVGLLQIVMFSVYGNQYEDREEHLLLSMFEVKIWLYGT